MRRVLILALLTSAGCDDSDADAAARQASDALRKAKQEARKGYDKAEQGARVGYAKAEQGVRVGADKAGIALRKASAGAHDGYIDAKDRMGAIDWVAAFDSTREQIDQASDALKPAPTDPGPADAWWNRGSEAVTCEAERCTIAAWFVSEARGNPVRMMGDVKVLTALDDSGWLLESVREGSAAYVMGFRGGDIIRTIAGRPLTDGLARIEILAKLRKADEVQTTFVRVGETELSTLTIRFESAPAG